MINHGKEYGHCPGNSWGNCPNTQQVRSPKGGHWVMRCKISGEHPDNCHNASGPKNKKEPQ